MNLKAQAYGSIAFIERNFALIKRYIGWEIVFLSYNIVNALAIGLIGARMGKDMVLYLVVGAMVWANYCRLLFCYWLSGSFLFLWASLFSGKLSSMPRKQVSLSVLVSHHLEATGNGIDLECLLNNLSKFLRYNLTLFCFSI